MCSCLFHHPSFHHDILSYHLIHSTTPPLSPNCTPLCNISFDWYFCEVLWRIAVKSYRISYLMDFLNADCACCILSEKKQQFCCVWCVEWSVKLHGQGAVLVQLQKRDPTFRIHGCEEGQIVHLQKLFQLMCVVLNFLLWVNGWQRHALCSIVNVKWM